MAIYVPAKQPWLRTNVNVDLGRFFRKDPYEKLREEYYNQAMKALTEYEGEKQGKITQEAGFEPGQMPTEWEYINKETGKIVQPGQKVRKEDIELIPKNYIPGQVIEEQRRELTPEEQTNLANEYRARLEALGVKYPREMEKLNPYTMIPGQQGSLTYEQRAALKGMGKPDLFFDSSGNVFDARTQAGISGIRQSLKAGYNPRRPSTEAELKAAQDMYNKNRFFLPEEESQAIETKIKQRIFTPDERRSMAMDKAIQPRIDQLETYSSGSKANRALIEEANRKMRKYRPKNWEKLTQTDYEALAKIQQDYLRRILGTQYQTKKSSKYWEKSE